ncbi:MAG: hypothetical protein KDK70_30505 [Myxococcales bacterium]|nr:hypothetical protein [Myxococcales bacterium]
MRDPARIPELCRLLERAWARCPDARLGQLLVQALGPAQPCPQVFYAEDGRVRRGLERLASEGLAAPELPPQRDVEPRWEVLGEPAPSTVTLEAARLGSYDVGMYFCQVLEVRLGGEYRHGSQGSPDAAAMVQHVLALLARAEPDVVLLDLSELRYAWGDGLLRVFETIARFDAEYPLGVTVLGGPGSTAGLPSLGVTVHDDPAAALEDAKVQALQRSMDIG